MDDLDKLYEESNNKIRRENVKALMLAYSLYLDKMDNHSIWYLMYTADSFDLPTRKK